ncbi:MULTISPECIES: FAD:protein FMN transferase [Micromonospora]|uniref:FAD:protein FMN transferase n=1 Tax=Micromonospora yangpuensis TaxID=683228 RepID=A0A1C6UB35_9ACTN|nr:FAD:protein FMN transferase [Micromonospora yangpuensis]GGL87217.1 FAD:protein FMN transferase [Micromonospora yangpuensis]SCL51188.1 thiamine biosynthesis lipoprotein [Micromonospora yangpuensis]
MRTDDQPRPTWPDQPTYRGHPDLRLGPRDPRPDATGGTVAGLLCANHTVRTTTAEYTLRINAPHRLGRRAVGEALRDAVAELRAIDLTFGPARKHSLVSRLRRGEISPESYPPLADLVDRCAAMRAATDGWFDAWAVPGGFDPGGLLGGWAVERAAARLRAAGITDYAVLTGADLVVRGNAPHGGPWRVAVHHPTDNRRAPVVLEMTAGAVGTSGVTGRQGHVVDPHTGEPADQLVAATVVGPDLAVADAYATALYAAGPAGLAWFRGDSPYRALFTHRRR